MAKSCVLCGGGVSIREGIEKNLWEKLKKSNLEIWSLNFAYLTLPFLPNRQIWVDTYFFNNNIVKLQEMSRQGVKMYSKKHSRQLGIDEIHQFFTTRNKEEYWGKEAILKGIIYFGRMGLCGMFATSLAIAEGYNVIWWLGFDFGNDNKSNNTHYYQDTLNVMSSGVGKPEIYRKSDGSIKDEVKDFEVFTREKDVKIYNVSLISNIPYYEKISFETFFQKIENGNS